MNKKGIVLKILCFLGLTAVAYLEFCTDRGFFLAGWGGFGDISKVYTLKGSIIECIVNFVPPLLLLFILILRMIVYYRRKAAVKYYIYDVLFCAAAVGLGFIVFYYFKEPRDTIVDFIIHVNYENGWLEYPVP